MNQKFISNLYKTYILCLPLGRLVEIPLGDFFNKVFTQFGTLIMLVGVFYILLNKSYNFFCQKSIIFLKLYLFMASFSLLMSFILSISLSNSGESPFSTILGDIVLYFFVVLSVYFNSYCLTNCVSINSIYKIFNWQIIILLIVGYFQMIAMAGFSGPYSILTNIFALRDVVYLTDLNRGVTFFGSEPSSAAILCFIIIPFIYSCIQYTKGKKRAYYLIVFFLFMVLFLGSNSSQLLLLFFGSSFLFIWSCFGKIKKAFYYLSFFLGFSFAIAYLMEDAVSMSVNKDHNSFEYVILGKVVDRTNLSVAMRASTIINDLKVFVDYPLTGVGDGNQGFFYADNQPLWTTFSSEVSNLIIDNIKPNGGGTFFASYVSAYGFIGIIVFFLFLKKYKRLYRNSFLIDDKRMDLIFKIAIILFLFSGWHVVGIKQTETIIFILSLPCVTNVYKSKKL